MNISAKNVFAFLSYISPFLLAFTFILLGFMNGEPLKPIVYLGVLSLSMGIVVGLLKFNTDKTPSTSSLCSVWNILDDSFYRPSMSTYFITFTLVYTFLPMIMSKNINYYLLTFILFILAGDTVSKYNVYECITLNGLLLGFITALVIGSLSSFGLYNINPNLLFFGTKPTNNQQCGKRGKKFVCSVYKNGQLIKNL